MNSKDKIIYGYIIILTVLLLITNVILKGGILAKIIMVTIRVSLMIAAIGSQKKYREQRLLVFAFVFSVISDLFLTIFELITPYRAVYDIIGILGFFGTYLVLNAVFIRNRRFNVLDFLVSWPFWLVFAIIARILIPFVSGPLRIVAIFLGAMLCFTAANMAATIYRGFYRKKVSYLIAMSGTMIFVCDMFVAFSMFHPEFQHFIVWVENTTWIIYTGEWLLLLVVVKSKNLYKE